MPAPVRAPCGPLSGTNPRSGGAKSARGVCAAANAILSLLDGLPHWPQQHREHFRRILATPSGWQTMARQMVTHHSADAPGERKMRNATPEIQEEVLRLLFNSDFEARALSKFAGAAPGDGGRGVRLGQ